MIICTSFTAENVLHNTYVCLIIYSLKHIYLQGQTHYKVRVMVFYANFSNISVILWWSVLLVEETGENYRPAASHWQILSHNVVSSTSHHERDSSFINNWAINRNILLTNKKKWKSQSCNVNIRKIVLLSFIPLNQLMSVHQCH